jgi:hypothetical protein
VKIVHKDASLFTEIPTLEDQTTTIPQNAGHLSPDDAASHPIRKKISTTPMHNPKNSHLYWQLLY